MLGTTKIKLDKDLVNKVKRYADIAPDPSVGNAGAIHRAG